MLKSDPVRKGDWIQTFSGLKVYPLDPREEEIDIRDIAHALSNLCRFTGHCREFYSVAQHSVFVSVHCPLADRMWGLLHDASEAYLSDIARPVKMSQPLDAYRWLEQRLQKAIYAKFGLRGDEPGAVLRMDLRVLLAEARELGFDTSEWSLLSQIEPLHTRIVPMQPDAAERAFLDWFDILRKKG